jgi:putative membrane protein
MGTGSRSMSKIAKLLVGLIAAVHLYIAWLEIFAWTSRGPKVFPNFPPSLFEPTVAMAANQGIYNFFLAAGLIWALTIKDQKWQRNVALCFLIFVAMAGVFGAATVSLTPLFAQFIPALLAIAAVLWL